MYLEARAAGSVCCGSRDDVVDGTQRDRYTRLSLAKSLGGSLTARALLHMANDPMPVQHDKTFTPSISDSNSTSNIKIIRPA